MPTPAADVEVPLDAPEPPPGSKPEVYVNGHFLNVTRPVLFAYLNPDSATMHPAIIICAGGGYAKLAYAGHVLSRIPFFHSHGFTVFGLKYRTDGHSEKQNREQASVDLLQAIKIVHARAQEWKVDPNCIGLMGASAGSNLILNAFGHEDKGTIQNPDTSIRFALALSPWPADQKAEDLTFSAQSPAMMLASARDDKTAPVTFAQNVASRAQGQGANVLLYIIDKGGHGAFEYNNHYPGGDWTPTFLNWFQKLTSGTGAASP
jgi:acetyl esterase/lipase